MNTESQALIDKAKNRKPSPAFIGLSIVTCLGIVGMSSYKIGGLPDEHFTFWLLVLFVEIGAGLLVFAQAIIRTKTQKKGLFLYILSGVFRVGVSVVGFIVAEESPTITTSGLWTYQIANFLMFVLEIIFSVLISASEEDHKGNAETLATLLESANSKIFDQERKIKNQSADISRKEEELKLLNDRLASVEEVEQAKQEKLLGLLAYFRAIAIEGSKAKTTIAKEAIRPYADVESSLLGFHKLTNRLKSLSGILWTSRKATHVWVCPECYSLNEANYSQPKVCKNNSCNHSL